MVEESMARIPHEIVIKNRQEVEVTGVIAVESFDNEEFLLQTDYGFLGIRGQELSIKNLDLDEGRVSVLGHVFEMGYLDVHMPRTEKTKSFLGRIFR